jgi:hypothetical protein
MRCVEFRNKLVFLWRVGPPVVGCSRHFIHYRAVISQLVQGLGYGLDDRGSRVQSPAGAGTSSLHHRVQNGSGAHAASYPMGTRSSFPGVKRPGREADHSPPSSAEVKECVELYLHSQYAFMTWCSLENNTGTTLPLLYTADDFLKQLQDLYKR